MRVLLLSLIVLALSGCATRGTAPSKVEGRGFTPEGLAKTDIDRVVEDDQRQIFASLRRLALKLYRRNPAEWRKTEASGPEDAVSRLFDVNHGWRLAALDYRTGIEALQISLNPAYPGDRVRAFMVGLANMIQLAFNNQVSFYMFDDLDAQALYNAAHNVEIAAWKLANARDVDGRLLLLTNEMGPVNNLSFEREFGRIIGLLDLMADVIAQKSSRRITRVIQDVASAVFIPIR